MIGQPGFTEEKRMNLKTTGISLIVAGALGTLAFMGCTIGGGPSEPSGGDAGVNIPATPSVPSPPSDAGPVGATCSSKQENPLLGVECQACLENNCCDALKGCFDMVVEPSSGKLDCNAYATCIADCGDAEDAEACYKDCDDTAAPGIQTAFEAVVACGRDGSNAKCKTECADGTPPSESDAGADGG
jgi:hypothetical protein